MKVFTLSVFLVTVLAVASRGSALPKFDPNDPVNRAAWEHIQCTIGDRNPNFAIEKISSVAEDIVIENIYLLTVAQIGIGKHVIIDGNGHTLIYFHADQTNGRIKLDKVLNDKIPSKINNIGIGYTEDLIILVVLLKAITYPKELGERPLFLELSMDSQTNLISDAYAIKQDSLRNPEDKILEVLGPNYGAFLFPPSDLNSSKNMIQQLSGLEHGMRDQICSLFRDKILTSVSISALLQCGTGTVGSPAHYHLVIVYKWKIAAMESTDEDTTWRVLSNLGGSFAVRTKHQRAQEIAEIKSCRPLNSEKSNTVWRAHGHRIIGFKLTSGPFDFSVVKHLTENELKKEIKGLGSVDRVRGIGFALRKQYNGWNLFIALVVYEKPMYGFEVPNFETMKFNAVAVVLAVERQKGKSTPYAVGELMHRFDQEFVQKDETFDQTGLRSLFETDEAVGFTMEGRRGNLLWKDKFITVSIIYCRLQVTPKAMTIPPLPTNPPQTCKSPKQGSGEVASKATSATGNTPKSLQVTLEIPPNLVNSIAGWFQPSTPVPTKSDSANSVDKKSTPKVPVKGADNPPKPAASSQLPAAKPKSSATTVPAAVPLEQKASMNTMFTGLTWPTRAQQNAIVDALGEYFRKTFHNSQECNNQALVATSQTDASGDNICTPIKSADGFVGFRLMKLKEDDTFHTAQTMLQNCPEFNTAGNQGTSVGSFWQPISINMDTRYIFCVMFQRETV